MVVLGTIEKSESGLEMALSVVDDGAKVGVPVVVPRYCTVITFVPSESVWLFRTAEKGALVPEPVPSVAEPIEYPELNNSTAPVGATLPVLAVTVPVMTTLVVGETLPLALAVVVVATPLAAAIVMLPLAVVEL